MRRGGNCRAGVLLLLPESFDPDTPRLDLAGTALSIVAITGLVYGIIQVPIDGWADPVVLTSLAAGTVALAAFITWERRTRSPLVDLTLFGNRRFAWATAAATSVSFVMFGAFFLLPLYLHNVTGTDSLGTGLRLLPLVGGLWPAVWPARGSPPGPGSGS